MPDLIKTDLCIIGAGSGGLSVAAGASQMGASTVLIEKGKMGGDCLNYGCVPSKALLAAGHAAQAVRGAKHFGIDAANPKINATRVYKHVHGVIDAIAPMDSVERFEGLGVKVIQDAALFTGPTEVVAGGTRILARRFVIATGSSAMTPPIPGLDETPYFTNENLFDGADTLPEHLIVIGGGPIGIEMAQAHRQLGCAVTVLEMFAIMPRDDPELVAVLRDHLVADGVDIREKTKIIRVERTGTGVRVHLETDSGPAHVDGSHILVAAGRRANVNGLDLEAAGIKYSARGIDVDQRLRTSNKHVFAIGDVAGGYQFTHMAGYHAGIVIRNALFRLPAKVNNSAVPWVTYTDPELAHVGLSEADARTRVAEGDLRIVRQSFAENDRARAEGHTDGLLKVVATRRGKVLGAGIVGPSAGEIIQPWVLAMSSKIKLGAIAAMIAPYPTLGEINKRAAGSFFTPSLFGERTKKLVRFLARFG